MMHATHKLNGPTYAHEILTTAELIAALQAEPTDRKADTFGAGGGAGSALVMHDVLQDALKAVAFTGPLAISGFSSISEQSRHGFAKP
jgi:hypothetical protein